MPDYEFVTEFESVSKKGEQKVYTVKRRLDTRALTCNCPSWVFNTRGDRTCYHTMKVLATLSGMRTATQVVNHERVELPRRMRL